MEKIMLFEEYCNKCSAQDVDPDFMEKRKKAKKNKYKNPDKDKNRGAFMKNLMKDRIKK